MSDVSRTRIGVALMLAAMVGVFVHARSLDRSFTVRPAPSAEGAWNAGTAERVLPLGGYDVAAPGVVHASTCRAHGAAGANPHMTLRVRRMAPGARVESDPFESEGPQTGACFDAERRISRSGRYEVTAVVPGGAIPTGFDRVTVMASRRIMPWWIWPTVALLAGVVLWGSARPRPVIPREPVPPPTPPVLLGGIVPPEWIQPGKVPPGFDGGDFASLAALIVPVDVPRRTPPVQWRFAWAVSLALFVLVYLATFVVVAGGASALQLRAGATQTGVFLAASTFVQHGLMILGAAWFLGAFHADDARAALGVIPVRGRDVAISIGIGLALVAFALIVTRHLHDVRDTPMGRMVERMPVRFVIGFGALLAPASEELFFRGVFVPAFGKRYPLVGVLASAAIFTLMHAVQLKGAWLGLLPIAAVGLVNAQLRVRSGGLTQPWIVHCTYNAVLSAGLYFA